MLYDECLEGDVSFQDLFARSTAGPPLTAAAAAVAGQFLAAIANLPCIVYLSLGVRSLKHVDRVYGCQDPLAEKSATRMSRPYITWCPTVAVLLELPDRRSCSTATGISLQ